MSFARLDLGHGIGLRSKHYGRFLEERPAVDWVEAISENHLSPGGRTGRSTSRKWSWTRSRHARFGKPSKARRSKTSVAPSATRPQRSKRYRAGSPKAGSRS